MSEPDLLPCPFCSRTPRWIADDSYGDCMIFCPGEYEGCVPSPIVHMAKDKAAEAIADWNRRAAPEESAMPRQTADKKPRTFKVWIDPETLKLLAGRKSNALPYTIACVWPTRFHDSLQPATITLDPAPNRRKP